MIRYAAPFDLWGPTLSQRVATGFESGQLTNFGPEGTRLEALLAQVTGRGARAVSSGTAALSIAIRWAIEREGSARVLLPAYTFLAVGQAAMVAGALPVWYDIDPATLLPDMAQIQRLLAAEAPVAGLVVCPLYGFAFRDLFSSLSKLPLGPPIIVDSAHLLGAEPDQRSAFAVGDAHTFSFSAAKILGGAEGGAVSGSDEVLAFAERARNYGGTGGQAAGWGLNAKLSEPNAAIAAAAMERRGAAYEGRRRRAEAYRQALSRVPAVAQFARVSGGDLPLKETPLLLDPAISRHRAAILDAMSGAGVEARAYFAAAMIDQPLWRSARPSLDFNGARDLASRILCLPLSERMTLEDVEVVVTVLEQAVAPFQSR